LLENCEVIRHEALSPSPFPGQAGGGEGVKASTKGRGGKGLGLYSFATTCYPELPTENPEDPTICMRIVL